MQDKRSCTHRCGDGEGCQNDCSDAQRLLRLAYPAYGAFESADEQAYQPDRMRKPVGITDKKVENEAEQYCQQPSAHACPRRMR